MEDQSLYMKSQTFVEHDDPSWLGWLYFGKEHENVEDAWITRNVNRCKGFKCQHIVQSLHVELEGARWTSWTSWI